MRDKLSANMPERLSGLTEIAYNLWWSWHPAARMLFKMLDRGAWKESGHNPIQAHNNGVKPKIYILQKGLSATADN
jgi:glucan phosphorylase